MLGGGNYNYAIMPGGEAAFFLSGTNLIKLDLDSGITQVVYTGLNSNLDNELEFGPSSNGDGYSLYMVNINTEESWMDLYQLIIQLEQ